MVKIHLNLNPEAFRRLTERAIGQRRSVGLEAEVLVLRGLGLSLPFDNQEALNPPSDLSTSSQRDQDVSTSRNDADTRGDRNDAGEPR